MELQILSYGTNEWSNKEGQRKENYLNIPIPEDDSWYLKMSTNEVVKLFEGNFTEVDNMQQRFIFENGVCIDCKENGLRFASEKYKIDIDEAVRLVTKWTYGKALFCECEISMAKGVGMMCFMGCGFNSETFIKA